jgi:hypothetical protein
MKGRKTPGVRTATVVAVLAWCGGADADSPLACAVPGQLAHWQADWCMARLETDDEIAIADCLEGERQRRFPDDCAGKRHYRDAMCRRMVAAGRYPGSERDCTTDPEAVGATVRNGGA